jgi:hypothetical protein
MFDDYDAGILNDYGGGNVSWWQDYIRAEVGRANDFWRAQVEAAQPSVHPTALWRALGWFSVGFITCAIIVYLLIGGG